MNCVRSLLGTRWLVLRLALLELIRDVDERTGSEELAEALNGLQALCDKSSQ